MGYLVDAKCRDCGSSFSIEYEGGMFYHLVRCSSCGKTKRISFAELGILHLRLMKEMPGLKGAPVERHDIKPISEDEYYSAVEATAGACRCGGDYCLDTAPRCPDCGSTSIDEGRIIDTFD